MKRNDKHRNVFLTAMAVTLLASACGSAETDDGGKQPVPGDAYLTIVGDKNVFLNNGSRQTLIVKYHDGAGHPLAGEVRFRIEGNAAGAVLDGAADVTNGEGLAQIDLTAGAQGAAAFSVVAEADYAQPVDWRIAVDQGDQPPLPLSVTGKYKVESQFDIVSGLPGTVGEVVNGFVEMTDDPNDPATFLIDLAIEKISNNTVKNLVNSLRPGLDAYLNEFIKNAAPQFVTALVDLGDAFGQITRKFGLLSELEITAGGLDSGSLVGKHTITGVAFTVDGQRYEYAAADLDLGTIVAENVPVALEGELKVTIGDHTLPVSYGRMILFALNNVIIPQIDPFASSLEELLRNFVDCAAVGQTMYDYVGIGTPGLYESACLTGIAGLSAFVTDQILSLDDTATSLVIHGDAKPRDGNGDRKVEKLENGLWEGKMTFGSIESTLAKPNQKFLGTRMELPQ